MSEEDSLDEGKVSEDLAEVVQEVQEAVKEGFEQEDGPYDEGVLEDEQQELVSNMAEMFQDPDKVFEFREDVMDSIKNIMSGMGMEEIHPDEIDWDELDEVELEAFNSMESYGFFLSLIPYQEDIDREVQEEVRKIVKGAVDSDKAKVRDLFDETEVPFRKMYNGFQRVVNPLVSADGSKNARLHKKAEAAEKIIEGLYKPVIRLLGDLYAIKEGWKLDQSATHRLDQFKRAKEDFTGLRVVGAKIMRNSSSHLTYDVRNGEIIYDDRGDELRVDEEELDRSIKEIRDATTAMVYALKEMYFLHVKPLPEEYDSREEYWSDQKDRVGFSLDKLKEGGD